MIIWGGYPWGLGSSSCFTEQGCIPWHLHSPKVLPQPQGRGCTMDQWCLGSNLSYLQILGEPMQNRKLVAEISLVNPLAVPLNGCVFVVEGTGLINEHFIKEL